MKKEVVIRLVNNNKEYKMPAGLNLSEIADKLKPDLKYPVLGAKVNNELKELSYGIYNSKHIKFIDITDTFGMHMYIRSLAFILIKAFQEKFPNATLRIAHTVSNGLYCEPEDLGGVIYDDDVVKLKERMEEIVTEDIPFVREEIENSEAIKIYEQNNLHDKCKLFKNRKLLYTSVYYLGDTIDYFYGYLVPSTGYIRTFDLMKYHEGVLLRYPAHEVPEKLRPLTDQTKMFEIFTEHKAWAKILDVANVGSLNELILDKRIREIIKISEALHEKKVASIADGIYSRKDRVKLILISGPSSSGKTSFCKRLSVQLQVLGFKTQLVSLDNYFVDRDLTPKDENGEYNFECLEAIDINAFNQDMLDLMDGKAVKLPKFDFNAGKRIYSGKKTKAGEDTVFIVEGIHGLNPGLTKKISSDVKYKIYVSALTQVSIDNHNRIPTTDNRLIRRMVRDFKYRGYSSYETLNRWQSVRNGEEINIFPYQEEADVMFNSALLYEIAVLKKRAMPILQEVPESAEEYCEANRLIKFLSYFQDIPESIEREIPPTSIIREFIGGSSFTY